MAIPAMALLQQHDAGRDIVIEPVVRWRAAIEARGHSELGAQSGRKNQPACFFLVITFEWLTINTVDTLAQLIQPVTYAAHSGFAGTEFVTVLII